MKIWMILLPFAASGLLFLFLVILQASGRPGQMVLSACEEIWGFLKVRGKESSWYQKSRRKLVKNGAPFHYGQWINPVCFLAARMILAFLGFAVLFPLSAGYGILAGGALYFTPVLLLVYLNRKDNEKMLSDMKLVYHGLEMQIRAGVYVADALAECYGCVREKRLRQAFLDLAGDIVMKADIYEALKKFQEKFDNRYIDSLCITLFQALESGQAVELLGDIGEQIKDMETVVLEKKKNALDRSLTFYQLGVLAAVLGIALYACVMDMFAAAVRF